MKKHIINLIKHPLISGSSIVVVGSMMASVLNYLFNLEMGRMLSVSDYGIFSSLISLFNIFSVFSLTIITVFTKFTATFVGEKNEKLIRPLFIKGSLWIGGIALIISGLIIIFSSQISHFLNITQTLLVDITSVSLFFAFLTSIGMGILQGALKFFSLSFLNIFSSIVKLVLGVVLVVAGFKALGAVEAFFLASLFAYIYMFFPLREYIKKSSLDEVYVPDLHKSLSIYAIPVFFSTLGMTAFVTIDIILVKHFFNPDTAGQYSALSLMGRSIFYVVAPITTVLFPLIA